MEDSAAAIIYHGMTFHVVVLCCVTLFLLLVSALVSGSETAFFSLSGNDVRKIRRHDTPVCRRMLNLLGKADLLLATILVVNNLVNIGIVILSFGDHSIRFFHFSPRFEFSFSKTVIVTFLLLLFGEILPKVAAQTIPLRFAGFAARPFGAAMDFFIRCRMCWCAPETVSASGLPTIRKFPSANWPMRSI